MIRVVVFCSVFVRGIDCRICPKQRAFVPRRLTRERLEDNLLVRSSWPTRNDLCDFRRFALASVVLPRRARFKVFMGYLSEKGSLWSSSSCAPCVEWSFKQGAVLVFDRSAVIYFSFVSCCCLDASASSAPGGLSYDARGSTVLQYSTVPGWIRVQRNAWMALASSLFRVCVMPLVGFAVSQ